MSADDYTLDRGFDPGRIAYPPPKRAISDLETQRLLDAKLFARVLDFSRSDTKKLECIYLTV